MLTIKSAAQLLARAESLDALLPLARLLGFDGEPVTLTARARREAGLADHTMRARFVSGIGMLRLCLVRLAPPSDIGPVLDARERTRLVGAALLRHAPTRLWCVLALDHDGHLLCLATVSASPHGPRIAALRLDRRRVLDSDADTVRALAAVTDDDPSLRHARFTDILRRDALTHRFYRALEQAVTGLADSLAPTPRRPRGSVPAPAERRELALLVSSRLLFLAFLEAKGWLDGRRDFLMLQTVRTLEAGGGLHERLLRPLFFGTLNTPRRKRASAARAFGQIPFLNGGLFTPTPLEKRFAHWQCSDDALTMLLTGVIDRYRFTAREDSSSWSEAAVDPEMLGRAFESLMADDERRRSGSYYTPPPLVQQVVRDALQSALPDLPSTWLEQVSRGRQAPDDLAALPDRVRDRVHPRLLAMRVLDPACGSGAFLVHTLETLDHLLVACGDSRPAHVRRRDLLLHSIFGVDRQPLAVWLCELRLWLSVVIDTPDVAIDDIPPLPNLDHHIRIGDSLAGGSFEFAPPAPATLAHLRARYARASGTRKQSLARQLDTEERARTVAELDQRRDAIRREREALLIALRARDLFGDRRRPSAAERTRLAVLRTTGRDLTTQRRRLTLGAALPFRFGAMFADVARRGGFTLVVGNPPWVRPHAMPVTERRWLRHEFRSMRFATWQEGAARAGAGTGFAGQADLAVAFIERALQLLAPRGTLALLVPAKLWRTLAGGGIRRVLLHDSDLRVVHDWSDAPAQFDAATYPSLIVATRRSATSSATTTPTSNATAASTSTTTTGVHVAITRSHTTRFTIPPDALSLGGDPGAPWVLMPPPAHAAFEALRHTGTALAHSPLGRPLLGVKCGCNAAFLVHAVEHDDDTATVTSTSTSTSGGSALPRQGVIERTLLRPALRGEDIGRAEWARDASHASGAADAPRIIWTHDRQGHVLRTLPPATTRWLAHWRPRLSARADVRHRSPWWTLFRTEAARCDVARVVWADIGRRLRTRVLLPGDPTVPLNSCYVVRAPRPDDAFALNALLQSTIAAAWLDALAEPARGGFRRYLGWTVAALPLPNDWREAALLLAPLGEQLAHTRDQAGITMDVIDEIVAHAYGIPILELTPLLDWYRA